MFLPFVFCQDPSLRRITQVTNPDAKSNPNQKMSDHNVRNESGQMRGPIQTIAIRGLIRFQIFCNCFILVASITFEPTENISDLRD